MAYLRKDYQSVLHNAGNIIERRKETLTETEAQQYEEYKEVLSALENESETFKDQMVSAKKKYQQTQKCRDTNREAQRRFRERQKAKAKEKE